MPRKSSVRVPDWAYYLFAALITLPTIPIYIHFFRASRDASLPPIVSASPVSSSSVVLRSHEAAWYPLPAGTVCAAGLVVSRQGNSYREIVDPLSHRQYRCTDGRITGLY